MIDLACDQEKYTSPPPLIISQGLPKILWFLRKLFAARVTGKVVITDENLGVFEIFEGDFDHVKLLDVKGARIQEIPQGLTLCSSYTCSWYVDSHRTTECIYAMPTGICDGAADREWAMHCGRRDAALQCTQTASAAVKLLLPAICCTV